MIVKKYKADTETAAILAAKEDLGPEAVVLNVKTMKQRGFARFFKHDYVEITAALEEKEFEQKVSSRRPAVNAAATKEIKPAADKMSGIDYRVDDSRYTETGKNTIEQKLDSLHDMLQSHMTGLDKTPGNAEEKDVEQKETSDNTAKPQNNNFKPLKLIYNKLMENEMDEKYANAIERLQNTDLPTAKVAAEFGLNPETFRMYLREHHPELVTARGMIRTSDGKVVSNRSAEKYAEALRIYVTTSESLKSIAKRLGLTYNSVGGFIRRNYPEAIEKHNSLLVSSEQMFAEGVEMLKSGNATIHAVMDECGYNE